MGYQETNLKTISGINIQWPWSELIASGEKKVETRNYPIPEKYLNQWLAIIETPGKNPEAPLKSARIIGVVRFSKVYIYENFDHWKKEQRLHRVSDSDKLVFSPNQKKWAWRIDGVSRFKDAVPPPKRRGVKFALSCIVPNWN